MTAIGSLLSILMIAMIQCAWLAFAEGIALLAACTILCIFFCRYITGRKTEQKTAGHIFEMRGEED